MDELAVIIGSPEKYIKVIRVTLFENYQKLLHLSRILQKLCILALNVVFTVHICVTIRNLIANQLPKYQIQRLQKTQNRVASCVLGPYVKEDDLIKTLGWLPVTELVDFCMANCCFSALHYPN